MRLKKISIQNFRGLSNVALDLDATTVLIGENNTGKTSILEAVRMGLGRTLNRKATTFEDYDYYLPDKDAQPGQAGSMSITFWFIEDEHEKWKDEIVETLGDDIIIFVGEQRAVIFRIVSTFDNVTKAFVTDWEYLDSAGKPLPPKTKRPQVLSALQQFCPVFYLAATREAVKDFGARSPFWAPFLKNPNIDPKIRVQLEEELNELNAKIIGAHKTLKEVKANLEKTRDVVPLGGKEAVTIEALPGRAFDALSRAQVSLTGASGATVPLQRHGAGTQSLAVMFLFEAFLKEMLSELFDSASEPILTLEEPEAHLHPSAIRTLWQSLQEMKGQKIIATHSGDLLAEAPLLSIRRLYRNSKDQIVVGRIAPGLLIEEELRKLEYHVRYGRGELFFARCWVLVEGETDHHVLTKISDFMGKDYNFEKYSVRIVAMANVGIKAFIKSADALGITWHCLADNDSQGKSNAKAAREMLNGRSDKEHLTVLSEENIELYLCKNGFGGIYEDHISPQKKDRITAKKGCDEYWKQVLSAQDKTPKPTVAIEAMNILSKMELTSVPKELKAVVQSAVKLAKRQ